MNRSYLLVCLCLTAIAVTQAERPSTRERVYKVRIDNSGPRPRPLPIKNAPTISADEVELPPTHIPCEIPPPRTISHSCRGVKTVLRPQATRQLIRIPVVRRYIQTMHKPVVETVVYRPPPCVEKKLLAQHDD